MNPKFRSVSLNYKTYDKVGSLSKTITPGINLSFASTIDYAVEKLIEGTLDRSNGRNNGTANVHTQEAPD
jgi:hypothetical protein